jgi:hypothetical protein
MMKRQHVWIAMALIGIPQITRAAFSTNPGSR